MSSANISNAEQPSVDQLRADLAFVDRMIAECQQHIVRLKKATAEMSRDGQDTDLARDVLASFVAALTRHEAQRRLVVSQMEREAPESASVRKASLSATSVARRKVANRRRTLAKTKAGNRSR
jgi:hypothetical protein